jgi:hypothetical protein
LELYPAALGWAEKPLSLTAEVAEGAEEMSSSTATTAGRFFLLLLTPEFLCALCDLAKRMAGKLRGERTVP